MTKVKQLTLVISAMILSNSRNEASAININRDSMNHNDIISRMREMYPLDDLTMRT
jgi:hypothetical protein